MAGGQHRKMEPDSMPLHRREDGVWEFRDPPPSADDLEYKRIVRAYLFGGCLIAIVVLLAILE
jgi:hypothetical protein